MEIKKLTPSITAKHLANEFNVLLQKYVGEICLFWDDSTHYYGCMGGDDSGIVGLIRKISAKAKGKNVVVKIETCDNKYEIDLDSLCIDVESNVYLADEDSEHFECDENGNFEDVEIEPMFSYYDMDVIENYYYHDSIGSIVADLVIDNFMGKECVVTDLEDGNNEESEEIESVDYEDDDDYRTVILINECPIEYKHLKIQVCE